MLRLLEKHPSNEGIVSGEVFQTANPGTVIAPPVFLF